MGSGSANKAALVDRVSRQLNLSSRDTARLVEAVLASIRAELMARGQVRLKGFGLFTRRLRKGRAYRHPVTCRDVAVPDRPTVVFKPSDRLIAATRSGPET